MRQNMSWGELSSAIISAFGIVLILSTLISTPAEARRHYYRYWHPAASRHVYRPVYSRYARRAAYRQVAQPAVSAMVVDANTGKTLYAANEDQLRHPASITKVMTLYLLFEQIENGHFRLDSPIAISSHAAAQPPTKLGLPPGATIRVEDAIKAIVTESANDIAVAVAEAIGGDEDHFAALMTETAHALGMAHTFYRNASGLPNDQQLTTARDLIVLGRALQQRFPREYAYFSTRVFYFEGRVHVNHNHLLGRIEGMDGIKTGYTRSSGFNLLTSVRRNGRHIVSVVLGGTTAGSRDQIMAGLVERNIQIASVGRDAPVLAEATSQPVEVADSEPVPVVPARRVAPTAPAPRPAEAARAALPTVRPPAPIVLAAQPAAPILPTARPTAPIVLAAASVPLPVAKPRLAVVSGAPKADQTGSIAGRKRIVIDGSTTMPAVSAATAFAPSSATPMTLRWVAGPAPAATRFAATKALDVRVAKAEPIAPARPEPRLTVTSVAKTDPPKLEAKAVAEAAPTTAPAAARTGWIIQIGATDDAGKANDLLTRAKSQDHATLASAQPFTEKVQKGDLTLYRARFAGLESDQAEAACKMLKRSGFDCFATKN